RCSSWASRAAVEGEEAPVRARRQLVDVARDDFLPRARLALDEHRALAEQVAPTESTVLIRQLVDVARDDFLPRARLALDEHRALGGRHLLGELEHFLEGARLAQGLHQPGALTPPDFLLELLVLRLEQALLRGEPAGGYQVVVRERVLDVVGGPLVV